MTREEVEDLLAHSRTKTLICIGDLLLDRFVDGYADRVSREAPVLSFSERSVRKMPGGVGNVARNLSALGASVVLISVVGNDDAATDLETLIASDGQLTPRITRSADYLTPTKSRFVASGHQTFSMDRNPSRPVPEPAVADLLAAFGEALSQADGVVISDYGRGVLTQAVLCRVIDLARSRSVPVFVDPRGKDYTRYDGATLIKPNALELQEETGLSVRDDRSAEDALRRLGSRLQHTPHLLVTRGGAGITILETGGKVSHVRSSPRQVFDVSGAGDTTLASLALGYLAGVSLGRAAEFANRVAGIAVTKAGTATVSPDEIIADFVQTGGLQRARVLTPEDAAMQVQEWKSQGLIVGLTNGCFDILHAGHLHSLEAARALCDRLVVALNDDAGVRALKGDQRPINPLSDRTSLIGGLRTVDLVTSFAGIRADDVLRTIRPSRYFKGDDYTADTLPEAATAREVGAECHFLPLLGGRSTTNIVQKSRAAID